MFNPQYCKSKKDRQTDRKERELSYFYCIQIKKLKAAMWLSNPNSSKYNQENRTHSPHKKLCVLTKKGNNPNIHQLLNRQNMSLSIHWDIIWLEKGTKHWLMTQHGQNSKTLQEVAQARHKSSHMMYDSTDTKYPNQENPWNQKIIGVVGARAGRDAGESRVTAQGFIHCLLLWWQTRSRIRGNFYTVLWLY